MTFFTEESAAFLRGLAADNSKAFFDAHRRDYETHVKAPYRALAEALVAGVREAEPEYDVDPAKAVYRINRDVRFSSDKAPYNTQLGVTIGRTAKHDPSYPGYTCRVGVGGVAVAGGLYLPDRELRDRVRRHVGEHTDELRALVAEPDFARVYGGLQGESHQRVPAELRELAEREPLVRNTQWIFWADLAEPDLFVDPHLDEVILDHWAMARPVMEFLKRAVA